MGQDVNSFINNTGDTKMSQFLSLINRRIKKSQIFLLSFLFPFIAFGQIQKGLDIDGEGNQDRFGITVSMPDVNTIAIGAPFNDNGGGVDAGHVRIYSWNGSAWVQKGVDIDGNNASYFSGGSVSMPDANTVVTTAGDGNAVPGYARVYEWNGSSWMQKGIDINYIHSFDGCCNSSSMPDANTVAIGSYRYNDGVNSNVGLVRIFSWNGIAWVLKGAGIPGIAAGIYSGWSVSMPDANTVAIGAIYSSGTGSAGGGYVRIFEWNGSSWQQKGNTVFGEAQDDASGQSVSMPDPNTVAIGANKNDGNGIESGHVRIFSWNGIAWVQKGLDIDGESAGDWFGTSVSMPDSNIVAVGAVWNDGFANNAGHTRIYEWNGNSWVQRGVDIDGETPGDLSGRSVSMPDNNTVGVGAIYNGVIGSFSGHVRVYTGLLTKIEENNFDSNVQIQPNPTSGNLVINLNSTYDNIKLILHDINGRLINEQFLRNAEKIQYTIDAAPGEYLLEIISGKEKAVVRVIKQ